MKPTDTDFPEFESESEGFEDDLFEDDLDVTDSSGAAADPSASADAERIAKVLARSGVCSRRDAEKLIAARRVRLNGVVVETPATLVTPHDTLSVDGKVVAKPQTTRVWRYHKPPGLVTTHHDPQGRPTVFDAMPSTMPRVISVGRLDLNSEGLLLLTNDGALARQFEHPSNGWTRRYRVRVFGAVDPARLALLAKGVTVDGVTYGSIQADIERQSGANSWLTVTLTEGKNREIRKVMDYLGYRVNRLVRVSYGPFYIGRLERSELEEIPPKMLAELLDNVAKAGSVDDVKPVRMDRTGWAKAKDKPVRPGSKRANAAKKAEDRGEAPPHRRAARPTAQEGARRGPGRPGPERTDGPRAGGARNGGPRTDASGGKGPRSDSPRSQGSRSQGPRSDGSRSQEPRSDSPRSQGPRSQESRSQDQRSDRARPDGARPGAPRSGAPRSDAPRKGAPRPGGGPRPRSGR